MRLTKKFIFWADKISIEDSSVILANGEYMKGVLEKTYGIKAVSCPAGAYPVKKLKTRNSKLKGTLSAGSKKVTKPYLLITNRHFAQKRFEYAISAMATILKDFPDISLVITGAETEYTDQIRSLVKRLSLNEKVKFLGLVTEKELEKLYQSALVYLYTAPEEDFGMGVVEAMAKGAPVVAWNNAGPSGIIKNGETGLLAKPFIASDFADKVSSLIKNKTRAKKIGGRSLTEVKKRFSYQHHLAILERYLGNVNSSDK